MKNKISAVIVDDERLARKELTSLLRDLNNVELVGEADNIETAVELIHQKNPDVVFLDIQLPGESGFDLPAKIDQSIQIIFVTAFDEHAIRAFEINALDYLLKPVNPDRLKSSIERLSDTSEISPDNSKNLAFDDRLFLTLGNTTSFIKVEDIVCINSAGDYSEVILNNKKTGLVHKSMKEWETRLPESYFCRIHRSTIINLEFIEKIDDWFNNSYQVYLKGLKEPLLMSRRFATKIRDRFK